MIGPSQFPGGIKVEDEAVGMLDIGDTRGPGMQLHRIHVYGAEQALEIVDQTRTPSPPSRFSMCN
jgi:hypothetical protein